MALATVLLSLASCGETTKAPDPAGRLVDLLETRHPDGAGPFPAVMLVPVCSGLASRGYAAHYREMAERLEGLGYLVVYVDYVAARQLGSACGSFVTPDDVAKDISTVARHLRSSPLVDRARIDAIGESLGGGGVLAALGRRGPDDVPSFRRAVVFYPVCRGLSPPLVRARVLMLFGGLDDMTPAESCRPIVDGFPAPSDVQVRIYPGARHGFDLGHLAEASPTAVSRRASAYHPAAAKAAWEDAAAFLTRREG